MNDEQFQSWLAQHGGEVGRSDNEVEVDDPSDTGPKAPGERRRQIKQIDSTTITAKDGATIKLRRLPGPAGTGDIPAYQVVEQTPPKPVTGARTPEQQTVDAAAAAKAAQDQKEREANNALPPDQDPAYETNAERAKRAQDRIAQQGRDAETARQAQRQAEADQRARAEANKPSAPTLKPDGKGGTIAVQTMPDGSVKTTPLPGVPSDAQQVTVSGVVYEKGPDGAYAPAKGIPLPGTQPGQAEPPGAPPMTTDVGQIAQGLKAYSDWLNQQVALYQSSGGKQGMAPEAASKAMERRIKLADSIASEQQNVVTTQSNQRSQDITQRANTLQDTSGRRTTAQAIYDNTLNQFVPMIAHAGKGNGGLVVDAMQEALGNARGYIDSYGGLRGSPEIGTSQFPALNQARSASLAPTPPPDTTPRPVTGAALGDQPAPGVAPPPPQTPAAANPVSTAPIFVPQAPAPSPTTPLPTPTAGPSSVPPHNAGTDTRIPVAPTASGTMNLPQGVDVSTPPADWQGSGGPVGMGRSPLFMSGARFGQEYNPSGIVQQLANDPSTDNGVLAEAYRQLYGTPMPGAMG